MEVGGVTGIAWETGLLAGLAEAGIDLTSADLAAGCDRVVVVAPITFALRRGGRIENQLASLGSTIRSVVISPDAEARKAIGSNVLDPAHRVASARAGHAQSAAVAESVAAAWK